MDLVQLQSTKFNNKRFSDKNPYDKTVNMISLKAWKEFYTKSTISDEKFKLLIKIIGDWDEKNITKVRHLAKLCMYLDDCDEIYNLHLEYFNLTINQRKARTEQIYILSYGEKEGLIRYNKYVKYSKENTLKIKYIKDYGEKEGEKKWQEYLMKLSKAQYKRYENTSDYDKRRFSPRCIEYWLEKGYSEEDSECLRKKAVLDGQKNGVISYYKNKKNNPERYENIHPNQIGYWLNKGYSKEDGEIERQKIVKKSIQNLESFIKRHGEKKGKRKWEEYLDKRRNTMLQRFAEFDDSIKVRSVASKESLKVLLPFKELLINDFNIKEDDIYIGIDGSQEFWLAGGTTFYYAYDFTIRSKKLIIEFNGERWHPNPIWKETDIERWNKWETPYKKNKLRVDEKYALDTEKILKAEEKGFKVLVLWSEDSVDYNIEKCLSFIKENISE